MAHLEAAGFDACGEGRVEGGEDLCREYGVGDGIDRGGGVVG